MVSIIFGKWKENYKCCCYRVDYHCEQLKYFNNGKYILYFSIMLYVCLTKRRKQIFSGIVLTTCEIVIENEN